jgi:YYY domain-containing protein
MIETLTWWLLVELIGIAVWPVAFRFFRNLPERGYSFIKSLGLLLIAYPFWLFTTFGFLTNTRGAIALVVVGVAALSWWFFGREQTTDDRQQTIASSAPRLSPFGWVKENARLVLTIELVFAIAFFAWTIVRACMPEITATEKPMEFAFLNGVLQSSNFPPHDPWLSGYAISYYYFGYIIIAMLTMLSGIASSITFNLGIALLFALAATGAFGLAYDLIRSSPLGTRNWLSLFYPLFAPIFLLLAGNLEGFFEALHAKGIGSAQFWNWLDVKGLAQAPVTGSFVPNDNWWWWRASRVVHDVVAGQTQEVIDEFPQFSFLLGDMHPHVLALPFVLLALAAALNLIRNSQFTIRNSRFNFPLSAYDFSLLPLILGGLFFLNSWDILPYGFILLVAFGVARYRANSQWDASATRDLVAFTVGLGVLSVFLYLPFYIGFQSQAGGLLPTLFVKTQLHQYLIMFGLFVFILGAFVARLVFEHRDIAAREWLTYAAAPLVLIISFPIAIALLALVVLATRPDLQDQARAVFPGISNLLITLLAAYFAPLATDPWLFILLAIFLTAIVVMVRGRLPDDSTTFVLLLAFTGFLLTFGVEFVYLRDQFGTRMNTVFKFYFQAWTLFSIAAAYAVFYLSQKLIGIARGAWFGGLGVLLAASLVYPVLAIPNRADNFTKVPTLDGIAWIRDTNPGDYEAIQWLDANAPRGSNILEAPGDDYSYGNRISMATDRAADVARIYQTLNSQEALTLLDKYDIKFVVVGPMERSKYGLSKSQVDKFGRVMTLVFNNDDDSIYARAN